MFCLVVLFVVCLSVFEARCLPLFAPLSPTKPNTHNKNKTKLKKLPDDEDNFPPDFVSFSLEDEYGQVTPAQAGTVTLYLRCPTAPVASDSDASIVVNTASLAVVPAVLPAPPENTAQGNFYRFSVVQQPHYGSVSFVADAGAPLGGYFLYRPSGGTCTLGRLDEFTFGVQDAFVRPSSASQGTVVIECARTSG